MLASLSPEKSQTCLQHEGDMPPRDVHYPSLFVLRCWAAAHGVGLYVRNKLLLLFLLTCFRWYSWEAFSKISKEKKDCLCDAPKPPEFMLYIHIYIHTHTDTIQQKLPQLFGKKDFDLLCQFWSCMILCMNCDDNDSIS